MTVLSWRWGSESGSSRGFVRGSPGPVVWGRRCRTGAVHRRRCAWCRKTTAIPYLSFDWRSARTWPDLLLTGSCPIEQRGSDFLAQTARDDLCESVVDKSAKGEVRSPVLGRRLPMSRWGPWPPQFSVSLSEVSWPTSWPVSRSEPVPLWCSVSCCGRSSPGNDDLRWSAVRNNSSRVFVVEAVGVRFFAPGTTPEMPLRAATCREAQDGHRPCEAADTISVPAASSSASIGGELLSTATPRPNNTAATAATRDRQHRY